VQAIEMEVERRFSISTNFYFFQNIFAKNEFIHLVLSITHVPSLLNVHVDCFWHPFDDCVF
jgi:hypothetical protein